MPAIPGIELAGMIVEQGAGTTEPAIGQPVFVSARDLPVRAGCYAEYIAVPAHAAHPLPPGCSLEAKGPKRQQSLAVRGLQDCVEDATPKVEVGSPHGEPAVCSSQCRQELKRKKNEKISR